MLQDKFSIYSKTCLIIKRPLRKKTKIGFQDRLSLNAGQKYCRMLEHSAILSTFIKLLFVIKIFVLSIFEWPLKTGFTVSDSAIHSEHTASRKACIVYNLIYVRQIQLVIIAYRKPCPEKNCLLTGYKTQTSQHSYRD